MEEVIIKHSYENSDIDGYSFKIHADDQVNLEIVGFDFEYFSKISPNEVEERLARYKKYQKRQESKDGVGFLCWNNGSSVTRMQKAAYFAMLEGEGLMSSEIDQS